MKGDNMDFSDSILDQYRKVEAELKRLERLIYNSSDGGAEYIEKYNMLVDKL
jgi:hypothetical protein